MARQKITCECRIIMEDGRDIPFEDMTDAERDRFFQRAADRLSAAMSDYFTLHPELYHLIPDRSAELAGNKNVPPV